MSAHYEKFALITGASGGLGSSLVAEFLNDPAIDKVVAVSRSGKARVEYPANGIGNKLIWVKSEYSEAALNECYRYSSRTQASSAEFVYVMESYIRTHIGLRSGWRI